VTEPIGHLTGSMTDPISRMLTEPFGQRVLWRRTMRGYRELSQQARSAETEGSWVDFPASPDPDPWATLLRKANRLPSDAGPPAGSARPGRAVNVATPLKPQAAVLGANRHFSFGDRWDAKSVGGAVMTSFAIVLRGLLVTSAALATVAYLLLTNSHI
jgi:hypothetical protein